MTLDFVTALGPWTWFVIGLLLIVLELVVPGTFMLWFGAAAFIVGANAIFFDWPWQAQIIGFAVIAGVLLVLGRRFFSREEATDQPLLNERGRRLVGREFVLGEPITEGYGRVVVDDSVWRISGPDCVAGTRVRVVAVDGASLAVEPALRD